VYRNRLLTQRVQQVTAKGNQFVVSLVQLQTNLATEIHHTLLDSRKLNPKIYESVSISYFNSYDFVRCTDTWRSFHEELLCLINKMQTKKRNDINIKHLKQLKLAEKKAAAVPPTATTESLAKEVIELKKEIAKLKSKPTQKSKKPVVNTPKKVPPRPNASKRTPPKAKNEKSEDKFSKTSKKGKKNGAKRF
jgi:hypothetical protein